MNLNNCTLCPRKCHADRSSYAGCCGASNEIIVAKTMLHQWEEPCISVKNGAGTIFFSGCSLHCCFCQNRSISSKLKGNAVSVQQLADMMLGLQEQGADNIELVTPTHFAYHIIKALDSIKHKLIIPVIYNCGGYELTETIDMLNGYVDVYLPDLKYFSAQVSAKYSNAPDYFDVASAAVLHMIEQVGNLKFDKDGKLLKGTIIRHLVLPNQRHDSMSLLGWIDKNTSPEQVLVSVMFQYTPFDFIPDEFKELKRRLTRMECRTVSDYVDTLSFNGYTQSLSAASEKYVPDF